MLMQTISCHQAQNGVKGTVRPRPVTVTRGREQERADAFVGYRRNQAAEAYLVYEAGNNVIPVPDNYDPIQQLVRNAQRSLSH